MHNCNSANDFITISVNDLFILIADLFNFVKCPDCQTTKISKKCNTIKGGKIYYCNNKDCKRDTFTVNQIRVKTL